MKKRNSVSAAAKSIKQRRAIMKDPSAVREKETNLCDNLKFTAAEAYKLLRTNLMFTIPSDKQCRIVGISSALPGEGKSVTSINLSYTIAETGKKVLLIDADMRLPNIARQLDIESESGLSNVLAGLCGEENIKIKSDKLDNWDIITAGDIPPNPSELLGSEQMSAFLKKVSADYDFVIIDLPPINVVTDALTIIEDIDGILVVVRQNYASRQALKRCMRQLEINKDKLLGFVMTGAKESVKTYGKYGKYGKYQRYGHNYEMAKEQQAKNSK